MSLIAGNLGVVQRLLDANKMQWGVCAGVAAHLYGDRRPIQDVDILVKTGKLPEVVKLLQQQQKAVQFDGQRILWRGIKLFDDLSVRRNGTTYPFTLDEPMMARMRRMSLLGAPVTVLAPEDVLLHKLLMGRGAEHGKHDLADAAGIVRRQQLDLDYLRQRMQSMNANGATTAELEKLGVRI
jgi:putative nucleotidyltransferase-like protein